MSNNKESSATGTDNRVLMLEEDDYESWKIRMERYIRSKGDGKKIWKSIMSGPATTPRTPILDATGEATTQTREKTDDEFTKEENARELIDYKAASEKSSRSVDPLAYLAHSVQHQISTHGAPQSSSSSSTPAPQQLTSSSREDAMMATMDKIFNLLSTRGNQAYGNVTNKNGKKNAYDSDVDEDPHAAAAFMANLTSAEGTSGTSSEVINEVHTYDHNLDDNNAPDDNNDPYDNCRPYGTSFNDLVLMADVTPTLVDEVVPPVEETTVLSPQETPNESPSEFEALLGLQAELHGYVLANREQLLEISNLNAKLCKLEIKDLDCNKVKHDLDQAILDRNRRNEELRKETELLKAKLSFQTKVNETLESDKAQILSDKNVSDDKFIEEIVCLKNANQVMSDLLKTYQQPTHTIPMLSNKKTKLTTSDLHKVALGRPNPQPHLQARKKSPSIYDANVLLHPDHERLSVWQSKETLALDYEKRAQLLENPGIKRDHAVNIKWWLHARMVVLDHFMPFIDMFRKRVYDFAEILKKEVKEFEHIFDDLAAEYDQGVKKVKCLEITNRNLVRTIDCLISDNIASEVSALVLTADNLPLETQDNPSCVREIAKCLELEAEFGNLKKQLSGSEQHVLKLRNILLS
nr:hypothetical protein [Tanacetum cinerariifolium]